MNKLGLRVLSAVLGIAIVIAASYYGGPLGLQAIILLVVILGARELTHILFQKNDPRSAKNIFYILVSVLFILASIFAHISTLIFAMTIISFYTVTLFMRRSFSSLDSLLAFQAKTVLGLFYLGLLPSYASRLLALSHGVTWFFALLSVVFVGDTAAYFCGSLWGKRPLLPEISPKKTLIGAAGGLAGSALAGAIFAQLFLQVSTLDLVLISAGTGAIAQAGDFFESVLKRVANIKDSGTIMPGHGGVLDRIDGVLFASPFFLLGALYLEGLL